MNIIRPSADLRNKYGEVSKQAKEEQKPIYITVNGRGDTVLINQTVYERQLAELELLRLLAEADNDVLRGDIVDAKSVFEEINKTFNKE
jgi:prevent-host-death family protein